MSGWADAFVDRLTGLFRYLCRVFLMGATLAGVILISVDMFRYLFNSSDFSVQEITIDGNERVSQDEILTRAGLAPGANIWLIDLNSLAQRIEAHPAIHRTGIQRIPPHQIHIVVEERAPAAFVLCVTDGAMYGLDREGVVLPPIVDDSFDRRDAGEQKETLALAQSRPLLTGAIDVPCEPGTRVTDERVLAGLELAQTLAESAPGFTAETSEFEFRENGDLALHLKRRVGLIVLRDLNDDNLAIKLNAFWNTLEKEDLRAIYVDARFPIHGFAVRWDERNGATWKKLYRNEGPLAHSNAMKS